MTNPTKIRRRFSARQRQEAVELCLSEGLSCTAVAQPLRLPNSSLAKWVKQARIDRGDFGPPEQCRLASDERAVLAWLRKENRELRSDRDSFRLAAALAIDPVTFRKDVAGRRLFRPPAAGLIQSLSQGLLPGLSAWVEVGGIASSLCTKALPPQPIST